MATTSPNSNWRGLQVNLGFLAGLIVSFVFVISGVVGFQHWLDSRIDSRIASYANVTLIPRIVSVERAVRDLEAKTDELNDKLDTQDSSRNRQYGEMKSNQEKIFKLLDRTNSLLIKK